MILVRDVFQAKYGRGDDLVALFKAFPKDIPYKFRILTDASGAFFTVVTEIVVENFAEYERLLSVEFGSPEFAPWFEKMVPLVETGRREFYNIVE